MDEREADSGLSRRTLKAFDAQFGLRVSWLAYAPGRAEILGNHTDYNGGGVIACALGWGVCLAAASGRGSEFRAHHTRARRQERDAHFGISQSLKIPRKSAPSWVSQVLSGIKRHVGLGAAAGLRLAVSPTLPLQAGLGTWGCLHAAVSQLCAAMVESGSAKWNGRGRNDSPTNAQMALACQRAEHGCEEFLCGLMDAYVPLLTRPRCALFIDCDELTHEAFDWPEGLLLALVDSRADHPDGQAPFAQHRLACEIGAAILRGVIPHPVRFLRDVAIDEFEREAWRMPETYQKCARHVIQENERVVEGREALRQGDWGKLGSLMFESHQSSRELLGNSHPRLDLIVETAKAASGALGAKLQGAGHGGFVACLVSKECKGDFQRHMEEDLAEKGLKTRVRWPKLGGPAWYKVV